MNKMLILLVMALLAYAPVTLAADSTDIGSGNRGFTISLGYDGSYLHYEEKDANGNFLDKDTGYMQGLAAEARYETAALWSRITFDYTKGVNVKYQGFLQPGNIPLSIYNMPEKIYRYEADLGYKAFNFGTATLTPYVGIGYRWWRRDDDSVPYGYAEKYTWYYGVAGLNYVWRIDRWTVGADASAHLPFNMELKTDYAGAFSTEETLTLARIVGFSAELPFTYDVSGPKRGFFIFLTPYYQYWPIGASNTVPVTYLGMAATFSEPSSRTNIYGTKVGVGVNF